MNEKILIIEDDAAGRELAVFNLTRAGYQVHAVADGTSGIAAVEQQPFDLVITDVKMPGISGIDVLKHIKRSHPTLPVVIITAYANVEGAVEAMKLGAADFLGKPFSRDHLLLVIEKALRIQALSSEVRRLRIQAGGVGRPILYASAKMAEIIEVTDRFAASDASVLISGQSGTGKELIARRIHTQSSRVQGPFVAVNLAAMPETLIESELFGHRKGAFTGAVNDRPGRFRQASGGTIFLDEIAELPLQLQGKLLRVLQEKQVDSLGDDKSVPIDVRVVAATNRNLSEEVESGRFRADLFYRINVVQIDIPPLCERPDDIEHLARHFIGQFSEGRTIHIPNEIFGAMRAHSWPGNIRELENVCQRLVLLSKGDTIQKSDLPFVPSSNRSPGFPFGNMAFPEDGISLLDLEKDIIEKVLQLQNGNVSKAAAYLRIPRHILAYRMEKYGITK